MAHSQRLDKFASLDAAPRRALFALFGSVDATLLETHGLADAVPQEIQLGPADDAPPLDLDLGDLGRVQRKFPLDAFAAHNPPHDERLARARSCPGDDHAIE